METIMKPDIDAIRPDDILFFLFAEGGAMGSPGSIEFLVNADTGIIRNISYYLPFLPNHITNDDIVRLFPPMENIRLEMFGGCTGLTETWRYVSLGAGNHLFVRTEYYDAFSQHMKGKSPAEIYGCWYETAVTILS